MAYGSVIGAIRDIRDDASFSEFSPMRFVVVSFVESQPFRSTFPLPNPDTVNSFDKMPLIIMIGAADMKIQRIAVGINDEMAFQPFNPVFS